MKILNVNDSEFKPYGRIVKNVDFSELISAMKKATKITDKVVYEPSVAQLEATETYKQLKTITFGELPIQIGYCNGKNYLLNAVEYHRSSEINLAVTDAIVILGSQQDIEDDFTYDTSKMKAFLIPAGTAVEFYATTLHYAPCNADENGFMVSVILPKDTNLPLDEKHVNGEDKLITAKNKWLIAHKDGGVDGQCFIGLKGDNLDIRK